VADTTSGLAVEVMPQSIAPLRDDTVNTKLSSRERLSHFLDSLVETWDATCLTSSAPILNPSTAADRYEDSVRDLVYINCGNLGNPSNPPPVVTPRSLLQCSDLQQLIDNHRMNIVLRNDLFQDAVTSVDGVPLGAVYFHYDNDVAGTNISAGSELRIDDAEKFLFGVQVALIEPWYEKLSLYIANALNCTCEGYYCQCPIVETSMTAETKVVIQNRNNIASGVKVPNFFPPMFQLLKHTSREPFFGSSDPIRRLTKSRTADPVTPSVAILRNVYAEMDTGRVYVSSAVNEQCSRRSRGMRGTAQQDYLIQFNQCYVKWSYDRRYKPFRVPANATTSIVQSNAKVFDSVILLTATWSMTFYHSTVEILPRLLLLEDFIKAHPNLIILASKYAADAEGETFLYNFAQVWGLERRIIFLDPDDVIFARLLYIPEPTPCGQLQPLMARFAQSAIRDKLSSTAEHSPSAESAMQGDEILVIRRRNNRSIRNHDEMMESLQSTFPQEKWFVFDEASEGGTFPAMGLAQWSAFSRAKIVIAPHGGGLSNILACQSGTHVVEFYGQWYDADLCYLHLAVALNMNHHPMIMDALDANHTYVVDVPRVVNVVRDILRELSDEAQRNGEV
jgi:Glycosyltransferase 61